MSKGFLPFTSFDGVTAVGPGTVIAVASVTSHLVRHVRANLTNISGTVASVTATIATGGE